MYPGGPWIVSYLFCWKIWTWKVQHRVDIYPRSSEDVSAKYDAMKMKTTAEDKKIMQPRRYGYADAFAKSSFFAPCPCVACSQGPSFSKMKLPACLMPAKLKLSLGRVGHWHQQNAQGAGSIDERSDVDIDRHTCPYNPVTLHCCGKIKASRVLFRQSVPAPLGQVHCFLTIATCMR